MFPWPSLLFANFFISGIPVQVSIMLVILFSALWVLVSSAIVELGMDGSAQLELRYGNPCFTANQQRGICRALLGCWVDEIGFGPACSSKSCSRTLSFL